MGDLVLAAVVGLVLVTVWVSPILVASRRGKSNVGGIAIITLLLGWTVVGWFVALVMACAVERRV